MYKKIVVPVDFGQIDKGERILNKAAALLDTGGEIVLMTVVEDMPGYLALDLPADVVENAIKERQGMLADLQRKTGIPATLELRTGAPAREIIAAAEEHKADLVIVASHVPDLANYFIGATADRVVRHCKCSVLVDR